MLAPKWSQLKIGPILRGETDARWYRGLFQAAPGEISGLQRAWLILTRPKIAESDTTEGSREEIRVFSGWADYFKTLNGYHVEIKAALEKAIRAEQLEAVGKLGRGYIACHVRRGDLRNSSGEYLTSTAWYEMVIKLVRNELGRREKIYIFSDGTESELQSLLALPGVARANTGSAIADLWGISQGVQLIAAGGSTFSAWGAFLGQMPFITPPGHPPAFYHLQTTSKAYCGEFNPAAPDRKWFETWR